MTATQIDPRTLAAGLGIDTLDLATLLRQWAIDQIESAASDLRSEFVEYDRMERFDERVLAVRLQLSAAVEAEKAWHQDNPFDEED